MQEAAAGLSDTQITRLADMFGVDELPGTTRTQVDTPGRRLASRGTNAVPACTACHGPDRAAHAPIAPLLGGQSQQYLVNQLQLWRAGERGGGLRAALMQKAAQALTDAEILQLAEWYAQEMTYPIEAN